MNVDRVQQRYATIIKIVVGALLGSGVTVATVPERTERLEADLATVREEMRIIGKEVSAVRADVEYLRGILDTRQAAHTNH